MYLCPESNRRGGSARAQLGCVTGSICVFHLGIFISLDPAFISLLSGQGQEGEGSFQFPVTDGGCILHWSKTAFGFFKSVEGSDNFVLPSKSLLPPCGSSPALQVAPAGCSRLSDAGERQSTSTVPPGCGRTRATRI